MIQRTQSLWLFLVFIGGILLCFFPVMTLDNMQNGGSNICQYEIGIKGLEQTFAHGQELDDPQLVSGMTNWGLTLISIIYPLIALITIFLYKHRIAQARLCVVNIILMLGYYALLAWYSWLALNTESVFANDYTVEVPACIPLVSVILTVLALRGILKDEALIRSMNRIR